jgi:site-specific DNA-cytosine methylase
VVTGKMFVGGGPHSVADPRAGSAESPRFNNVYRIVPWDKPSPAVTGQGGNSSGAVADPRGGPDRHVNGKYRITAYDEPASTVIASSTTGNGAFALADPRGPDRRNGALGVLKFDDTVGTVQGESLPSNGGFAVADPRPTHGPNAHQNKHRVVAYDAPAPVVTTSDRVGSGALSVGDPRPEAMKDGRDRYLTQGHYGVVPWDAPSRGVTGSGQVDNGAWAVADIRALPAPEAQLVCLIRALDGTWHRPFTTLELAALQSLFDPEDGLELTGASDASWRERIGNAVPSSAAQAIASTMGQTLLLAWSGESFMLSTQDIWVRPLAIALSVDTSSQPKESYQ